MIRSPWFMWLLIFVIAVSCWTRTGSAQQSPFGRVGAGVDPQLGLQEGYGWAPAIYDDAVGAPGSGDIGHATPEPTSLFLLAAGFAVGLLQRRRRL
jgi:hypothetical protein